MRRAVSAAAFVIWLSVLGALGPSTRAAAHAGLESSSPSASATLESSPRDIILDFSEPVTAVEDSIVLFDETLAEVELAAPQATFGDRIEVRDVPVLDDGLYLVTWRVLSQDGHMARGAFTFQIGIASTSVTADDLLGGVSSSSSAPAGLGIARHVARAATYLGSAALLGTLAFSMAVGLRRVRRVIAGGWAAAALGSAVHLATQVVQASGRGWSKVFDTGSWIDVTSTRLGRGLLIRIGLLLAMALLLLVASRRSGDGARGAVPSVLSTTWWRSSAALVGAGIVATFASTGHPSASSPAAVAVAVDAVHYGSVLLWLGGLIGMLVGERTAPVVRSFSRMAEVVLPIAVITGVWQAWHLFGDGTDLTREEWGRSLVVKTCFVVVAAAIGMVARWIVRSGKDVDLRRLVAVEVAAAAAIIAATSVMVSAPPRVEAAPSVVTASLAQDEIIANVTVTPGGVGPNEIHVAVITPGGTLSPVEDLEIRLVDPTENIPALAVDVTTLGPNHFLGSVSILQRGDWSLELLVRVSPSRIVRLATTVVI